jgi:4'-phosphopantetheinyl transferase EntD
MLADAPNRVPFSVAWVRQVPFGVLAAVHLPGDAGAIADNVLGRLASEERAVAQTLRGFRQHAWVGGRLAWHQAARAFGLAEPPALLSGSGGEPLAPSHLSVSISHKRHLAVALVADLSHGTVGLDLEETSRDHSSIAERVLRPEELSAIGALPQGAQGTEILARFALKEATYKAIYPHLRRYVGFDEATTHRDAAQCTVTLLHRQGDPVLSLDAILDHDGAYLIAQVRARAATR